jgi:hypothetical protein
VVNFDNNNERIIYEKIYMVLWNVFVMIKAREFKCGLRWCGLSSIMIVLNNLDEDLGC